MEKKQHILNNLLYMFHLCIWTTLLKSTDTLQIQEQKMLDTQMGVHSIIVRQDHAAFNILITVQYEISFPDTPQAKVWFTEIDEDNGETLEVIYFFLTFHQTSLTELNFYFFKDGTQVISTAVQWIASTSASILMQDIILDQTNSRTTTNWVKFMKQEPGVLFFYSKIEIKNPELDDRISEVVDTAKEIIVTSASITIHHVFGGEQTLSVVVLAFDQSINDANYLISDICWWNGWINQFNELSFQLRYPVDSEQILRGFYAFNNKRSNFSAKIQVINKTDIGQVFVRSQSTQPLEGVKLMFGQISYVTCPMNSILELQPISFLNNTQINPRYCSCVEGYYEEIQECKACPVLCTACQSESFCLSCVQNASLKRTNMCICDQSYFQNQGGQCSECPSECKTCESFAKCLTCKLKYCLNNVSECKACIAGCDKCENEQTCITCSQSLHREKDQTNTCVCEIGYYDEGGLCSSCKIGCTKCTNLDICQVCSSNENRVLSSTTSSCICDTGFYQDKQQSCRKCHTSCLSCIEGNKCLICALNRVLLPVYTCQCKQGFFESGTCTKCQPNCRACLKQTICLECQEHRNLQKGCICNKGYIEDEKANCKLMSKFMSEPLNTLVSSSLQSLTHQILDSLSSKSRNQTESVDLQLLNCIYPCLTCKIFNNQCTSCDMYHKLTASNTQNIKLQRCEPEKTVRSYLVGAFDGINRKLKSNETIAVAINLGIPIGVFGLISNSPQFLLLDLIIKPIHPPKVYKSLESLARFVFPVYLPDSQGQHNSTSLILFGSFNATKYAYRYGTPLNESYMDSLGFSPYSIITCSQHLVVLCTLVLAWLLTTLLIKHNNSNLILKKFKKFIYEFIHLAMESGALFLAVSCFYTLQTINQYESIEFVPLYTPSIIISMCLLGGYLSYLLYIMYCIRRSHNQHENHLLSLRFPFFFYQVRTRAISSSFFKVTSQFRKLLYAFIVVLISTLIGYIILIILQFCFTIYIILVRPHAFVSILVLDVCLQSLFLAFLCFNVVDYQYSDNNPSGDGALCTILIILLFNLMMMVGRLIADYEVKKEEARAPQPNRGALEENVHLVNIELRD